MSKLTDIKYRIDQLDGGTFQNLCDSYLSYRGYRNPYSLGMKTGTNKTATGNPDTYFLTVDNKYIFVMYTTQKSDFLNKAVEDFDKCFDPQKTGVQPEDVAEIIYCHTYGRLSPGNDKFLRQYCETRGATLELIGLDQLANDIFCRYHFLAQDFLKISISSGQIMPLEVFIARHDANKMAAPLKTDFLFREKELEEAINALNDNDVLLIAGSAGVGKTRFALEVCQQLSQKNDYTVLVIKRNDLQLYDELVTSIESNKKYLVLVDDANELSGLRYVLDYLPKNPQTSKHISKLILTVRDYARRQVMNNILDVAKPKILKIDTFKDENIKKLMETCYGITNHMYLERIVAIAEGNARLAMLAGKFAMDSGKLSSIQDASELYRNYYRQELDTLVGTKTGIYSAGIIAFIQSIHLDYLEKLNSIFEMTGITSEIFNTDLKLLHDFEIVDLCNNKAAKISDQSFSNFLIKYVFVEKKLIPLDSMIETCFSISQSRTIYACNVLLNVFSESSAIEYVESQIKQLWKKLENNDEIFPAFFKAFHMVRPTETLILLQKKIEQETFHSFDIFEFLSKEDKRNAKISDDIIQILGNFKDSEDLASAIELLLMYYEKRPDLVEEFYNVFAEQFQVDMNSERFGYYTQNTVVDCICAAVEQRPFDLNMLGLFVRVAGSFLQLDFSNVASGRHNLITIYNFALNADQCVLEYRKKLWLHLQSIYQSGNMEIEISHILNNYGVPHHGREVNFDLIREEFGEILNFFTLFQTENLFDCIVANHIKQIAVRISYPSIERLSPFINSRKYKVFSALAINFARDFSEGYEKGVQCHKRRVEHLVKDYTENDINYLMEVCCESLSCFRKNERKLTAGIEYVFDSLKNRESLYLHMINVYINANTPYNIDASSIIQRLFEIAPANEVEKIITRGQYSQKNVWLWYFWTLLPEQQITHHWTQKLLQYFDEPNFEFKSSPYRDIGLISKYKKIDSQILFKALRLICNHYNESPFIFSLYVYNILNPCNQESAANIINMFSKNLDLLEESYLKGITYSSDQDCSGILLLEILAADSTFLYKLLDSMTDESKTHRHYDTFDTDRLLIIWETDQFIDIADKIFDYLHDKGTKSCFGLYFPVFRLIFGNKENRHDITERQDYWIAHAIERYSNDGERMYELFSTIENLSPSRRKKAVDKFLSLNADPDTFEKLPLEPDSWGGWGSMISHMQSRIDYLESLLPSVSQLKYLKQKRHIKRKIEIWKDRIHSEEISEMLEEWYH